jgi:serine/arginine repetitive matrix protein 2
MPAGSAVAFYRDSRVDSLESGPRSLPSVSFTVTSELDGNATVKKNGRANSKSAAFTISEGHKCAGPTSPAVLMPHGTSELKSQPASPEFVPALVQSKAWKQKLRGFGKF